MDSSIETISCVVDRDGMIVWASQAFVELFSHRAAPVGMMFSQLFPGTIDPCRHGEMLEDRDKLGRRRFFRAECQRLSGLRGERVSDIISLQNVTLMRTLSDLSRLTTQTKTPREMMEKALWILKETYGYLGLAGFAAREGEIELLASKGWTEKLKAMISNVPIAPDAPSMAGRCAYHRQQMVTTIQQYGLMTNVKDAIERIGGEFVVVTPLVDHDTLAGVLTIIHSRELTEPELDTLQTVCNQMAIALSVRASEEALAGRAEQADLYVELLAHEITAHNRIIHAWQAKISGAAVTQEVLWAIKSNDEIVNTIHSVCSAGGAPVMTVPLEDSLKQATEDAQVMTGIYKRKLNVASKPLPQDIKVDHLFRYALRNVILNSARHALSPTVDVEIKAAKDRLGTCKIEVIDNGPGIPDERKSGVFRREGVKEGGSGLYLVKKIVARHGGRVWIEDRVPGNPARGTRVVITLPPQK